MYLELLKQGYKLVEIDSMDIHYYFKLLNCSSANKVKRVSIESVL